MKLPLQLMSVPRKSHSGTFAWRTGIPNRLGIRPADTIGPGNPNACVYDTEVHMATPLCGFHDETAVPLSGRFARWKCPSGDYSFTFLACD